MSQHPTLVLVHPGSLCGSAESQLGKYEARSLQEGLKYRLDEHEGAIVVIDGFLSDEIHSNLRASITDALDRAEAAGHLALRVWGCDAGEPPFEGWEDLYAFGDVPEGSVFDGQEEAAKALAARIWASNHAIECTGAWARSDMTSGCVTSVMQVLDDESPDSDRFYTFFGDSVAYEADDPIHDQDMEEEEDEYEFE